MLSRLLSAIALVLSAPNIAAADPMFVILPEAAIEQMLNQCSRGTPDKGDAAWLPTEAEIARVDAAMPEVLTTAGHDEAAAAFASRLRQYVGIVRGGRKFVYVNVADKQMAQGLDWRSTPIIVCDGGSTFFGVEIDVETLKITHFSSNGYA